MLLYWDVYQKSWNIELWGFWHYFGCWIMESFIKCLIAQGIIFFFYHYRTALKCDYSNSCSIPLRMSLKVLMITLHSFVLVLKFGFNLNTVFSSMYKVHSLGGFMCYFKQAKLPDAVLSDGIFVPLIKLLVLLCTCGTFSSPFINMSDQYFSNNPDEDLHKATNTCLLEITLLIQHKITYVSFRRVTVW